MAASHPTTVITLNWQIWAVLAVVLGLVLLAAVAVSF
jgi:hypothetical protein